MTNWSGPRPSGGPRGRPYRFFLALTVMALCGLVVLGVVLLTAGPGPFLLGLFFALLPVPFLAWGVLTLDRYEPEPLRNLIFTFVWGAGVATLLALVLNEIDQAVLTSALGRANGHFVTVSVAAPIVEECAKGLVILGMFKLSRYELDGPLDGIVYAGAVGLGFAMTENVLYYSEVTARIGGAGLLATFVMRGVLTPFAHPLFTSATGIGLGYASITRHRFVRVAAPVAGLVVAVVLHGIWNTAAGTSVLLLALVYLCLFVPVFAGVLVVAVRQRRRLRRVITDQLAPYARSGLIAWEDVPMFASLAQRRHARSWARRTTGRRGARAMRNYQLAATELALLRDRADRHLTGPRFPAQREQLEAYLASCRQQFLEHVPAWPTQVGQMWPVPPMPGPRSPYG